MQGFVQDIEELTKKNKDFRRVLYTGAHLQLVLMALKPGQEIGEEVHEGHDQFFRVEKGRGEVWIDGVRTNIKADDAVIVPAGARHNVINTGIKSLKLYTLYGPPEHRDGVVHTTRPEAEAEADHFNGSTTEATPGAPASAAKPPAKAKPKAKPKAKKPGPAKAAKGAVKP